MWETTGRGRREEYRALCEDSQIPPQHVLPPVPPEELLKEYPGETTRFLSGERNTPIWIWNLEQEFSEAFLRAEFNVLRVPDCRK